MSSYNQGQHPREAPDTNREDGGRDFPHNKIIKMFKREH